VNFGISSFRNFGPI